jgi:hypothetical protein
MEIWKPIPNYEGLYEVSNLGSVKSLRNDKFKKEKILKQGVNGRGYFHVRLYINGISKTRKTHQLVAESFLNHKPDGTQKLVVDHINDNPKDNRLVNLQVVTGRFNCKKTQGKYSSKYKGVCWDKSRNKWMAQIKINGKKKHLGLFKCELPAHLAYQNKLKEIHETLFYKA